MSDFIVAIGLVLAIEGLIFAAFPGAAKRLAANALETPDGSLAFGRRGVGGDRRCHRVAGARLSDVTVVDASVPR